MPVGREEVLLRITSILNLLPRITSPWGKRSWNLQFLVSLSYSCYIPLDKLGPVVIEKKMLTHDARRTIDDGRKRMAIGHLSELTIIIFSILLPVGKESRLVEPDRIYPDPDRVCSGVGERLEVSVLGVQKWRRYVHGH